MPSDSSNRADDQTEPITVDPDKVFNHLAERGTVLTATRRLSRELVSNYDQRQRDAGRKAWPAADVLPWDAWLQRTWGELEGKSSRPMLLLGESQTVALWHQVVQADIEQTDKAARALWNTYSTAREANRAWRLVQEWRLDLDGIKSSPHSDHRAFLRWCDRFLAQCQRNHWVDSARLPELLQALITKSLATPVLLCGFDRITPGMQALIDDLSAKGSRIEVMPQPGSDYQDSPCYFYGDESAQWMAAGQWARQQLENNQDPSLRIAIVAPDLNRSRSVIEYALRQTLCPGDLLQPVESSRLPYHLSLGRPLDEYDATRGALDLLELLTTPRIQPQQVRSLILSPYLAGFHSEQGARGLLLRKLERRLNFYSVPGDLASRIAAEDNCPRLQQILAAVTSELERRPQLASYRQWSEWFGTLLGCTGWPGDGEQGSDLFQVVKEFHARLDSLGQLDLLSEPVALDTALGLFRNQLGARIFQPEAHDAPVQVMGMLESAGMTFDAVWLGGLVEEQWPGRVTPNPFIPVPMQRQAGIPQSTPATTAALCEQQMKRLAGSTGILQLSYFTRDGDVAMAPSALISGCASEPGDEENSVALAQHIFKAKPELLEHADTRGPALPPTSSPGGGTGLIRAQSQCPRRAFLQYRLGGDEGEFRQQGLDPSRRGILIHRLLDVIWQEIGDSTTLNKLSDSDLEKRILPLIEREAGRLFYTSGCGRRFFQVQQDWLLATLIEWFEVERQRSRPFRVLGRESKSSLELAGLELEFRIDRIDQFEDGSLGLVDYKTGNLRPVSDWGHDRPDEPQLPLYWLTRPEQVSMVAFGKVRLGDCKITGLVASSQIEDNNAPVQLLDPANHKDLKHHFTHWQELGEHWHKSMTSLATEFIQGRADIDPRNLGLCRNCPTPAFCRTGDRAMDDIQEGGSDNEHH